ncbi:MAG: GTPase Era [Eubacteriales bacterium]|nr:GTPase Era [Eubacteriales bacterium]
MQSLATEIVDAALRQEASELYRELETEQLPIELELILVDDLEIAQINHECRGIDRPTDVLSFPMQDFHEGKLAAKLEDLILLSTESADEKIFNLGSVLISTQRLLTQAEEYGHSSRREFAFLMTHSILHLIGFDHMSDEEESEMFAIQTRILDGLGLDRDCQDPSEAELLSAARRQLEVLGPWADTLIAGDDADQVLNFEAGGDFSYRSWSCDDLSEAVDLLDLASLSLDSSPEEVPASHPIRAGYVAIIGRPNIGKSTLFNALMGQELAITSHKAQTTRKNVKAIIHRDDAQVLFMDTPGVHTPHSKLGRFMEKSIRAAIDDADLVILMADARFSKIAELERDCIRLIETSAKPAILVLNKIDLQKKEALLPVIAAYQELYKFEAILPLSALKEDGIDQLIDVCVEALPESDSALFNEEQFTDQSERSLCAEYLRQQILIYTHQEIPHAAAVMIEQFEEFDRQNQLTTDPERRSLVRISAVILCERTAHKIIILGKQGQMLRRITASARLKMEELLGAKVYLSCHIKVRENWKNQDRYLKDLGYGLSSEQIETEIL